MPYVSTQNARITDRVSWLYRIKDWLRLYGSPRTMPVMVVNDDVYKTYNRVIITGTGNTTFNVDNSPSKRFYLTGWQCTGLASTTSGFITITITSNNVSYPIGFAFGNKSISAAASMDYTIPILCDAGSQITIAVDAGLDTAVKIAVFGYYEVN